MQEIERRHRQRFDMKVPVRIRSLDSPGLSEQMVESSNISAGGPYFSTEAPLDVGSRVEMFLTMPVEIAGQDSRQWRCTGHVVSAQLARTPRRAPVTASRSNTTKSLRSLSRSQQASCPAV